MTACPVRPESFAPGSAAELRQLTSHHLFGGLMISMGGVIVALLIAGLAGSLWPRAPRERVFEPTVVVVVPMPTYTTVAPPRAEARSDPARETVKKIRDGRIQPVRDLPPVAPEEVFVPPGSGPVGGISLDPPGGTPGGRDAEIPPPGFESVEVLPDPIARVNPVYPEFAVQAGVEGTVVMWVYVGVEGQVRATHIQKSVPMLDEAAELAVRQWRFRPARNNGHAVAVWVAIPIRFRLH